MTSYGALNALLAIWFFQMPQSSLTAVVNSCVASAGIAAALWFSWHLILGDEPEFYAIQEESNKWRLGRKDKLGFTIEHGTYPSEKAVEQEIWLYRRGK